MNKNNSNNYIKNLFVSFKKYYVPFSFSIVLLLISVACSILIPNFIKDLKQAGKFKNNIKIHSYHFDRLERLYSLNIATILIDNLHNINSYILDAWLDCYSHMAIKPECKNAGHILINSSHDLQNIQLFPYDSNSKVYWLNTSLQDVREYNELTKEDAIKFIENNEVGQGVK